VSAPFTPVGETARWRILYDLLVKVGVDGVLTYDDAAEALDGVDKATIQAAMRRAGKELLTQDNHAIEAVKTVGYRVVTAEEHVRLASAHQSRSRKQLALGRAKVTHVDMSALSSEGRALVQLAATALAYQSEVNKRLDLRQRNLEKSLEAMKVQTSRTDDEVSELRERLARIEERFGKGEPAA
jgi:hypothetical protein